MMTKTEIRNALFERIRKQAALRSGMFVAPVTLDSRVVRTRLNGVVCSLRVDPCDFEGWGVFKAQQPAAAGKLDKARAQRPAGAPNRADFVGEASAARRAAYLSCFPAAQVRLVKHLRGQTWLAGPLEDAGPLASRYKALVSGPNLVHMVPQGDVFQLCRVRYDGLHFWFDEPVAEAPARASALARALSKGKDPSKVAEADRVSYALAFYDRFPDKVVLPQAALPGVDSMQAWRRKPAEVGVAPTCFSRRTKHVDSWTVFYPDGQLQSRTITQRDLTIVSSGICLKGEDDRLDLTTLVGAIDKFD